MGGPGRADIVNAESRETGYSECKGLQRADIVNAGCLGRPDIVNAGSGETRYSECRGPGRPGYSECRVRGDRI
ncbi:unnamed protein product [Staurois parvus]|uniref:Uncharacterized protein n=1 Tax=Staurois parvus TaxID=386267 RepID=A0ABN9GDP2_9NEOB|nr:unnamed protein product [Staurois parvus]